MLIIYWLVSFLPIWLVPWMRLPAAPTAIAGDSWIGGDYRVAEATTPFNKARLARDVWTEVAIFEIVDHAGPYFVAYRDYRWVSDICRRPLTTKRFAVLIGREGCHFFAFADVAATRPVKLRHVSTSEKRRLPADIPLI